MMMKLDQRLKAARRYAGFKTQGDLASESGVNQQTISIIETGGGKESPNLLRLAIACGVRPEWLVDGTGEMVASKGNNKAISENNADYAITPANSEESELLSIFKGLPEKDRHELLRRAKIAELEGNESIQEYLNLREKKVNNK